MRRFKRKRSKHDKMLDPFALSPGTGSAKTDEAREAVIAEMVRTTTVPRLRQLITFSLEVAAAARAAGCTEGESIPEFIRTNIKRSVN